MTEKVVAIREAKAKKMARRAVNHDIERANIEGDYWRLSCETIVKRPRIDLAIGSRVQSDGMV